MCFAFLLIRLRAVEDSHTVEIDLLLIPVEGLLVHDVVHHQKSDHRLTREGLCLHLLLQAVWLVSLSQPMHEIQLN